MTPLFIQNTVPFALFKYYVFYFDKSEEQIDICLMLCFFLRLSEQCSVCSVLANRPNVSEHIKTNDKKVRIIKFKVPDKSLLC